MKSSFAKTSYQLHKKHFDEYLRNSKKNKFSRSWLRDDTVDSWRHSRMRNTVLPLLLLDKNSSWLTVGDGRYGSDAHFLQQHVKSVLATDISDSLLKEGKKSGFIKNFRRENAEKLRIGDGTFDYVFCKEAYHHFPRPPIALYEMLRVARKGVVLIEPHDTPNITESWLMRFFRRANLGQGKYFNSFEVSGNYVYKISKRELEKMALGLQLDTIAFSGIDDYYLPGVENIELGSRSLTYLKIRLVLFILEAAFRLGLRQRSLLVAIIFKKRPSAKLATALRENNFTVINLPQNPYL